MNSMTVLAAFSLSILVAYLPAAQSVKNVEAATNLYDVEGIVYPPDILPNNKKQFWLTDTRVYIKGGEHIGFLK